MPGPRSCARRPGLACRRRDARAGQPWSSWPTRRSRRRAGQAAGQARRGRAAARRVPRAPRAAARARHLARGGVRRRGLLAARPRRRGRAHRPRPGRLGGSAAPSDHQPGRHDAPCCTTTEPFLVAATRLGGRHGYDGAGSHRTARAVRSPASPRPTAASAPDAGEGRGRDGRPQPCPLADRLIDGDAAGPGASRSGYADDLRWSGGAGAAGRRRPSRSGARGRDACTSSPARPAASCPRSSPTWPWPGRVARSTCSTSRRGPTPPTPIWRPVPRGPRGARTRPVRAAEGSAAAGSRRCRSSREVQGTRARWPGPAGHRRRASAAAAPPTTTGGPDRRGRRGRGRCRDRGDARAGGRAAARRRAGDQPRAPGQGGRGVRPRLRREGRGLVQPAAGAGRHAAWGRPWSFSSIAGRFGNAGQTDYAAANDLLCKVTSVAAAYPARIRAISPGLDGVGRHRHGRAGLDPRHDGGRRHRHARSRGGHRHRAAGAAVRRSQRGAGRGHRARRPHRRAVPPTGGLDPDAVDLSSSGPMVGRVAAAGS